MAASAPRAKRPTPASHMSHWISATAANARKTRRSTPRPFAVNVSRKAPMSGVAVPVCEVPEIRVPAREVDALEALGHARRGVAPDHRDHDDVLGQHVVHPDEERGALWGIELRLGRAPEPVVVVVAPARD